MEEYVARYDAFAQFLNENGYHVYGLDTYGQGDNVLPDLSNIGIWPEDGFVKMVCAHHMMVNKAKENGLPTYIFSHSMGSYMGQDFIQRFSGEVEKVVLCGAGAKNPAIGAGLFLAKITTDKKNRDKKAGLLATLMFGGFNKQIKEPKQPILFSEHQRQNANHNCDKHYPIIYTRKKILISRFNDIVNIFPCSHITKFACKITQKKVESSKTFK